MQGFAFLQSGTNTHSCKRNESTDFDYVQEKDFYSICWIVRVREREREREREKKRMRKAIRVENDEWLLVHRIQQSEREREKTRDQQMKELHKKSERKRISGSATVQIVDSSPLGRSDWILIGRQNCDHRGKLERKTHRERNEDGKQNWGN